MKCEEKVSQCSYSNNRFGGDIENEIFGEGEER